MFQQIASRLQWDDHALVAQFYLGLKENIKDELAKEERPDDLQVLITKATRIDNRFHERQMERSGRSLPFVGTRGTRPPGNRGGRGQFTSYPKGHSYYGTQPMEIDVVRHKPNQRKKRDPKDVTCYQCGKKGHYKNECRSQQVNAPRQVRAARADKGKVSQVRATNNTNHASMSWTACCDDYCNTHVSEKEGSGWWPKKPRAVQLRATNTPFRGQNQPAKAFDDIKDPSHPHHAVLAWWECLPPYCPVHFEEKKAKSGQRNLTPEQKVKEQVAEITRVRLVNEGKIAEPIFTCTTGSSMEEHQDLHWTECLPPYCVFHFDQGEQEQLDQACRSTRPNTPSEPAQVRAARVTFQENLPTRPKVTTESVTAAIARVDHPRHHLLGYWECPIPQCSIHKGERLEKASNRRSAFAEEKYRQTMALKREDATVGTTSKSAEQSKN